MRAPRSALLAVFASAVVLDGCAARQAAEAPAAAMVEAQAAGGPRWTVALLPGGDVDVGVVRTRLCFAGAPPERVGPEHAAAVRFLADLPRVVDAHGQEVSRAPLDIIDDGARAGIDTSRLPPGACVAFDVDVEEAARVLADRDRAMVVGRALLVSPDVWLWRPKPWPASAAGLLVVDAPDLVVAPWPREGDAFVVRSSAFALQCYSALGALPACADGDTRACRTTLSRQGVTLDVARLDDGGPAALLEWLAVAVDDVAAPFGAFPLSTATAIVVPTAGSRPVLGAFLGRGGGASAVFYVARVPATAADDLDPDRDGRWVLTHELAHALLPPVARKDGWLNEGITTWHQEVLPARAGRRTRAFADEQLGVGFKTGAAKARRDGLSLERACVEMDARGSYQHCYWGGAALTALLAREVGDEGVFALVAALGATGPIDGTPRRAEALLEDAAAHARDPRGRRAAAALLSLWRRHRAVPFPARDAVDDGALEG